MTEFIRKIVPNAKDDVLAGITVSLAMIPEVVAFAFVAQIDPLMALSGAFIIGLITAIFGGRPGLISGAAGAVAVIFVSMIADGHTKGMLMDTPIENMGFFYLMACVVLMGIIQIFAGVFKLGRFVIPSDQLVAAIFLASSASDFITGHTLYTDGGCVSSG